MNRSIMEHAKLIEDITLGQLGEFYKFEDEIKESIEDLASKLLDLRDCLEDAVGEDYGVLSDETKENHSKAIKKIESYSRMADKLAGSLDETFHKLEVHVATVNDGIEDSDR